MSPSAIVIEHFTKRYGSRTAVDDLSLDVPAGSVLGFLGQNGAGKTTTIRALLDLIRPDAGRLAVLGMDSRLDAVALRRRVGYLPEEPAYYSWMTVDEILRFNAAFFPKWDRDLERRLVSDFGLPRDRRIRELSRGMKAKVGLVLALGSRPEILILDDPTSGLDAVVRREFLEAMIANVHAEGGTVFFSTHLLHEMERVADQVAVLHQGKLRLRSSLEALKAEFKKIRVVYPEGVPESFPIPRLLRTERNGHHALLTVERCDPGASAELIKSGASSVEILDLSLEEIFVETVKGSAVHA